MSVKMKVTAMGEVPALTSGPPTPPPNSASATAGGLEKTAPNVSLLAMNPCPCYM